MNIETTVILKAEEGKILRNKTNGIETPSVWLKIGESQEDWEEIDEPVVVEDENTEDVKGTDNEG